MSGWWGVALGVLLSFAVNEVCEVSPWLAKRIVPLAARLWTPDLDRREVYAEAWQAVIDERPGKLFKLASAVGYLLAGVGRHAQSGATEQLMLFSLRLQRRQLIYMIRARIRFGDSAMANAVTVTKSLPLVLIQVFVDPIVRVLANPDSLGSVGAISRLERLNFLINAEVIGLMFRLGQAQDRGSQP